MVNLIFIPPLERIALLKIASILWDENDIAALIAILIYQARTMWDIQIKRAIRERMIKKTSQLPLPELLEDKLLEVLKPVCLEVLKWRQYHQNCFPKEFVEESLDKLCWTQQGTVDRKKTAEVLVKNENTCVTIRYKLACIYCLEHEIPDLWDQLPLNLKKTSVFEEDSTEAEQESSVVIWAYNIIEELNKLIHREEEIVDMLANPYRHGFKKAVLSANKVAAGYFFQKLTPEEKEASLTRFVGHVVDEYSRSFYNLPDEYYSDILWFLLSQMTEEQQLKVFRTHSYQILRCFLDWPLQGLFMRIANSMWTFLRKVHYFRLLNAVANKMTDDSNDFNYQELFREFWQQSPDALKMYIINRPILACELLLYLFFVEDENNISLILRSASTQEKEDIIFCQHGKEIAKTLIYMSKSHLVKFFVQKCISSRSSRNKFKEELKDLIFAQPHSTLPYKKRLWKTCSELLRNLDQNDIKKRNMNEQIRRSKRLCNEKLSI